MGTLFDNSGFCGGAVGPGRKRSRMAPLPKTCKNRNLLTNWRTSGAYGRRRNILRSKMLRPNQRCASTRPSARNTAFAPLLSGAFCRDLRPRRVRQNSNPPPFCTFPELRHRMGANPAGDSPCRRPFEVGSACRAELRPPGMRSEPRRAVRHKFRPAGGTYWRSPRQASS